MKVIAYTGLLLALLLLCVTPAHQYSWMAEMAPGTEVPPDSDPGARMIVSLLWMLLVAVSLSIMLRFGSKRRDKLLAGGLSCCALGIWAWKFLG